MARQAKKKTRAKNASKPSPKRDVDDDDFDFDEEPEEDLPEPESPRADGPHKRDWRDAERYREERALRKLINDDLDEFDIDLDG